MEARRRGDHKIPQFPPACYVVHVYMVEAGRQRTKLQNDVITVISENTQ